MKYEKYESDVDEFLDAFRAWCDMNSHVITGDC